MKGSSSCCFCLKRRTEQRFRLLAISTVKSMRNNLFLFGGIALTFIVLATTAFMVSFSTNNTPPQGRFPLSNSRFDKRATALSTIPSAWSINGTRDLTASA